MPNPKDLLNQNYQGLVVSYQWLANGQNAQNLADALRKSFPGKVFVILDEVHHASEQLSFGKACEVAFPDNVVTHRLMTSGTPFRSDNNRILGNWLTYEKIQENTYECRPDFRYTLPEALQDEIIPPFSFVTLQGEFKYIRNQAVYEGQTFTNATSEQQLRDALNTAISVNGNWVEEAILWAYNRMKRDRNKGLPECATYVRVSGISEARAMKERIKYLTREDAIVVVSKDDDNPGSNIIKSDSSELIEKFASETGNRACSWIIGVNMLGEGVSIKRLKYRIHATNICARLSFMQDLGRLLRLFPDSENPEPVETLIPAHPRLIELATEVLNEVAHVIKESTVIDDEGNDEVGEDGESDNIPTLSDFVPLASTGEMGPQIVDRDKIPSEIANVAEWVIQNDSFFKDWHKTPAHLAQKFINDPSFFELFHQKYKQAINSEYSPNFSAQEDIPQGFPSEYANKLPDEKAKFAGTQVRKKVNYLVYLLHPKAEGKEQQDHIKKVYTIAKLKNGVPIGKDFIGYQGWEKIYVWLLDRIAHAKDLKGTEDL